ncbi:MAG: hypothetical protein J1F12_08790 [Muribaculaceae bacterium]|nr:hypothetical protein [Muribaculaceae bacterium]
MKKQNRLYGDKNAMQTFDYIHTSLIIVRKPFKKFIFPCITACCMAVLLTLGACTDDVDTRKALPEIQANTLTIHIPNPEIAAEYGATRSDQYQNTRAKDETYEANINELWFFAYPCGDDTSGRNPVIEKLTPQGSVNFVPDAEYSTLSVSGITDGDYHIYLLANFERYLEKGKEITTSISEEDLQKLVADFSTNYLVNNQLPMYCLNTQVGYSKNTPIGEAGVFTYNDTHKELYANLTFLCAKVRYTILFNKDDFSNNFSSNNIDFKAASASNIRQQTAWHTNGQAKSDFLENGISDLTIKAREYPDPTSHYFDENGPQEYENDLKETTFGESDKQRAWQGIVYLPENKLADEDRTYLTFSAEGDEVKDSYDLKLFDKEGKTLDHGKFYDVVVKLVHPEVADFPATVNVSDWDLQTLTYNLHGPYELKVSKTKLTVGIDNWTILGYDSNAEVSWNDLIPIYTSTDGRNYKFFEIERITQTTLDEDGNTYEFQDEFPNHIRVKINSRMPYDELKGKELSSYAYFYLQSGNLKKLINVELEEVIPVLDVTPAKIVINVRELISSGINSNSIPIEFSTNIDVSDNKLTLSGIEGLISGTSGYNSVLNLDLKEASYNNGYLNKSEGSMKLNFLNILDGNSFWTKSHEFTLTFVLSPGDGYETKTKKVHIQVVPYSSDYTIHFKCKQTLWTNPHIYVYQCLELPLDYDFKVYDTSTNEMISAAGKTVGYVNTGTNYKAYLAGLEYVFSNNASFRGWKGFGGTVDYDIPGSQYENGFVHLGGVGDNYSKSFSPGNVNPDIYDYNTNLNTRHYADKEATSDNHFCATCATVGNLNRDGNRGWPGIGMIYEGNGWWRYTLSGIATPGKAMIMFTNDHDGVSSNQNRFPEDAAVGIPLFDFPDNEGWFLFDNTLVGGNGNNKNDHKYPDQNFYDNGSLKDGPEQEFVDNRFHKGETILIKWKYSVDPELYRLWVWDNNPEPNKWEITDKWDNRPSTDHKDGEEYRSYQFTYTGMGTEILYMNLSGNNGIETNIIDIKKSDSKVTIENGVTVFTLDDYARK